MKEYLRELPQPVFSGCLYQMLVDAMGVFLPDDPDGNAKLIFSILDCLPKANRVSLIWPYSDVRPSWSTLNDVIDIHNILHSKLTQPPLPV